MSNECIFCKIVAGRLPACRVYEDADCLAFLDIGPIVHGHTLVIPKAHVDPLMEAPTDLLGKLIGVVRRVARAQVAALKADGVNVMQANGKAAGQVVPHLHFHVIPRFNTDGHHWNWTPHPYDRPDRMQALADWIGAALAGQAAP